MLIQIDNAWLCECCGQDAEDCRCSEQHDHAEHADGSPLYDACKVCGLHHANHVYTTQEVL
jgi:hypothetical protein